MMPRLGCGSAVNSHFLSNALPQRFYMRQIDPGAFVGADMRAIEVPVIAVDARPDERFPARRQKTRQRGSGFEIGRAFFVHCCHERHCWGGSSGVEQNKNTWSRRNPM